MISWNTAAQTLIDAAAASGARVDQVVLLYLGLTSPQRYAQGGRDQVWSGHTWVGLDFGMQAVEDEADARNALGFSFPGVTSVELSLALAGDVEGTPVELYQAIVDPSTGQVADAKLRWAGKLDIPGWSDGAEAAVHFTAQHLGDLALQVKPWRYTNDAQQREFTGDTFFDFDMATDGAGIVWPAASYFKQQG